MQQLQKIEIDWDIHRMIEAERKGFDEAPYLALRRLLKLSTPNEFLVVTNKETSTGVPWIDGGVIVPHGSMARMEYGRGSQIYNGQFLNGKLVVNGYSYDTLSAASDALAVTKSGKKTSLNGWLYWKVQFPGETKWRSLNEMRLEVKL